MIHHARTCLSQGLCVIRIVIIGVIGLRDDVNNLIFLLDFRMVILCGIGCRFRRHRYLFLRKCLIFVVDHLSFLAYDWKDRWNQLHAFTLTSSFAQASTFHLRIHRFCEIFLLDGVTYPKGLFEPIANTLGESVVQFGYFDGSVLLRINWCSYRYFLLLCGLFNHLVFLHLHVDAKSDVGLRHISVYYGLKRHILIIIAAPKMIRSSFEVRFRISLLCFGLLV